MSDSFTETTSEGWLGRIGSSIKGVLIGLIMIVAAFPVLFWNEGRAVKTRKDLDQGSKEFVSLESTEVNAANEGKLVHLTGMTVAEGERKDSEFNVSAEGLVLKRKVEMFQWHEDVDSKSKKKLGGSKETTKTYTYKKAWGEGRIDSSKFNQANDHVNPSLTLSSQSWTASPITVGGFTLSESLVGKINQSTAYPIEKKNKLPNKIQDRKVKLSGGQIYLAKNPSSPQVGDVRISYQVVKPTEVSIVSKQVGNSFEPFKGDAGTSINMLQVGKHTGASMFESAQQSNKVMTWILRVVGFVVMFLGFSLVFKPFSVLADVLPIAGSIVGVGTGIVAFLLAAPLSLVTIAVAWIFYRPLIGVPLLLLAGVGIFFLIKKLAAQKKANA